MKNVYENNNKSIPNVREKKKKLKVKSMHSRVMLRSLKRNY